MALILCLCLFIKYESAVAVRHSADEIKNLISEVEKKVSILMTHGADGYAADELKKIEYHTGNSKKGLADSENDKAYYEIMKAKSYFKLVDAKKMLLESEIGAKCFQAEK